MSWELTFLPSLSRSLKHADPGQKETVKLALRALTVYFENNNDLTKARHFAPRFFFKQLRHPFYEIGVEGKIRIILRREETTFTAILAGNHDEIRRFLANS